MFYLNYLYNNVFYDATHNNMWKHLQHSRCGKTRGTIDTYPGIYTPIGFEIEKEPKCVSIYHVGDEFKMYEDTEGIWRVYKKGNKVVIETTTITYNKHTKELLTLSEYFTPGECRCSSKLIKKETL